jgi:uncharacterized protein YhjY with autotransporter beta-barrel domain
MPSLIHRLLLSLLLVGCALPAWAAQLSVSVATSPAEITVDRELTYTISIVPVRDDLVTKAVDDVVLTYVVPPSLQLVSATPSAGLCLTGAVVECQIGRLGSGVGKVTLVLLPIADGTINSSVNVNGIAIDEAEQPIGVVSTTTPIATTVLPKPKVLLYFEPTTYTLDEGKGKAVITVKRQDTDPNFARAVSVDFATSDGSATAGEDYVAAAGTLVWEEGDTDPKKIEVDLIDDKVSEEGEDFFVQLSNPVEAGFSGEPKATVTIQDNEVPGQIGFALAGYEVGEKDGSLRVTVVRSGGQDGVVSVAYSTQDGSAKAGVDFQGAAGTLTWQDGDLEPKTFEVQVMDDEVIEGDKEFFLVLTNPTNGATLGQASASVLLRDNVTQEQAIAALMGAARNPVQEEMARTIGTLCQSGNAGADLQARCSDLILAVGDNPGGVSNAMQQWAPEEYASLGRLGIDSGFRQVNNISSRLMGLRAGAAGLSLKDLKLNLDGAPVPVGEAAEFQLQGKPKPGAPQPDVLTSGTAHSFDLYKLGVFVNGHMGVSERDASARESGFEMDEIGLTAGVDYRFADSFILGAALGYATQDASLTEEVGSIDSEGFHLGLYGTYYQPKQFFLDFFYGLGWLGYDASRKLDYTLRDTQVLQTASASPDGDQQILSLTAGYQFNFGIASITPTLRFETIELDIDPIREKMSGKDQPGSGLGVALDGQSADSTTFGFGLQFGAELQLDEGQTLLPQLSLEWVQESGNDQRRLRGRFLEDGGLTRFTLLTDEPDTSYLNVGLGASLDMGKGKSAFLSYETTFGWDDMQHHSFLGGLRMEF